MTNFGFDEQESFDQKNLAEKKHHPQPYPPCPGTRPTLPHAFWQAVSLVGEKGSALRPAWHSGTAPWSSSTSQSQTLCTMSSSLLCKQPFIMRRKRSLRIQKDFFIPFFRFFPIKSCFLIVHTWRGFIGHISPTFLNCEHRWMYRA